MVQKSDVEKLIVQTKKSNLLNHWNDTLFYNTTRYSGEIKDKEILLWRSYRFLRGDYPVFHLSFDENEILSEIKLERNPFIIFLRKFVIGVSALLIIFMFLAADLGTAVAYTIWVIIIIALLSLVLGISRRSTVKYLTNELRQAIESFEKSKNEELNKSSITNPDDGLKKEWTSSKILIRLILYPFVYF
ncbi:hypothetical protein AAU57_07685 [Nonlabens sp. YIK11]|uniref:hypothetical protein n=1 Tax=Nonlabens sp. YIK11 TaxID=1453349 RepID=UPI0006DCC9D2|nr:hypothetical protein [Nonlabens sp. YIK11]KQC33207.1 hypothetical protein AAU57_07685 [Nonlabens sp. YIK11]